MNTLIENTQSAIEAPEVIEAMKVLAKHKLGVCMPHSHAENGEFTELPSGIVSFEEDLKVSFHNAEHPPVKNSVAVGWRWNPDTGMVEAIARCVVWC